MLRDTRQYFESAGVLEVETPALSAAAVSDPNVESLSVSLDLDRGRPYYLHTSPEYCMKRLLCGGFPDIFQICRVFRDREAGRLHQPEFTMIEWYRREFGLESIIQDSLQLIATVLGQATLAASANRLSYRDAFLTFAGCDPMTASIDTLADIAEADESLRTSLADCGDDWLDLVLSEKIATRFPADRLTVLFHYPVSQAALARQCPSDPEIADRFEIFFGPHELANGYVELTDYGEQKKRFADDQRVRKTRGQSLRPLDADFLDAMRAGLPPCAGVAVGFDRLLMLRAGADDLRKVQTFAFAEPK